MRPPGNKVPLLVIAGPTASGKSAVGVWLAEKFGAEIISADSVQVYRHFNIGSGKPGPELTGRIKHHLIGCLDPEEDFNVIRFRERVDPLATDLWGRGISPLIVGGTGLYIRGLIDGISGGERIDPDAEEEMDRMVADHGARGLYDFASDIDPEAMEKIHPNDTFRIRRVVGVFLTCNKKLSQFYRAERQKRTESRYDPMVIVLDPSRELRRSRIAERVDEMLASGWRDEVRRLISIGYTTEVRAMRSLGYRILYEEATGQRDSGSVVDDIVTETRRFAKRQMTWFRKMEAVVMIPVGADEQPKEVAERIVNHEDMVAWQERYDIHPA